MQTKRGKPTDSALLLFEKVKRFSKQDCDYPVYGLNQFEPLYQTIRIQNETANLYPAVNWLNMFSLTLALPATFYTVFHSEFDTHVNLLTQIFKRTTNSDSVYCYSRCLCFFFFCFFFKAHWSRPLSWKSTSPWNHFLTRPNSLSVLTSKSFALQNTLALQVF